MKNKLLIVSLLVVLLVVGMVPTLASKEKSNNGVAVAECVGAPGKTVKMQLELTKAIFADYMNVRIEYDNDKLELDLSASEWKIDGAFQEVDTVSSIGLAAWAHAGDGETLKGNVLDLVFKVSEDATYGEVLPVRFQVTAQLKKDYVLGGVEMEDDKEVLVPVETVSAVMVKELAEITGTVTSYGDSTAPVMVVLSNNEGTEISYEIPAGETEYSILAESGNYTLTFSKTKHCPRVYEIDMNTSLGNKIQNAEILLYGDVDGNGTVTVDDAQATLSYYAKKPLEVLDGSDKYLLDVADVVDDGKINLRDAQNILLHAENKASSIDKFE